MPRPKKTGGAPKTQRKRANNEVKQATTPPAELSPEELAAAAALDQANSDTAGHTQDEQEGAVAPQEDTVGEEQAQGEQDAQQAATDEQEGAVAPQEDTVGEEQAQGEQDALQAAGGEQEGAVALQEDTVGEEQAQGEQDTQQAATDEQEATVAPQEDTVGEEQAQGEQDAQQAATDEQEGAVATQEDTVGEEQAQGEQDAQQAATDEQEGADTAQGDAPAEEQAPALRVPEEPAVPISAEISKLVFDSGDTRAFANLRYGGLTVERLRVKQDAAGLYVNMPKYKEDGRWKETCHFNSGQDRQIAENTVLSAYHQKLNEIQEQAQSESQDQAGYSMGMEMQ